MSRTHNGLHSVVPRGAGSRYVSKGDSCWSKDLNVAMSFRVIEDTSQLSKCDWSRNMANQVGKLDLL